MTIPHILTNSSEAFRQNDVKLGQIKENILEMEKMIKSVAIILKVSPWLYNY